MQDLARATIATQNCGFCVSIFFGTATLIAHRVGGGSLQLRSSACDPKLPQVAGMRITAMQRLLTLTADGRTHADWHQAAVGPDDRAGANGGFTRYCGRRAPAMWPAPRHRPLRGDQFTAAYVADGSTAPERSCREPPPTRCAINVAVPKKIDTQKPQFWVSMVARARSCIEQAPPACQTGQASVGIVPAQPSLGTPVPMKSSLLAAQSLPAL